MTTYISQERADTPSDDQGPKERIQLGGSPGPRFWFLRPRYRWPILIISGQIIVLTFGWTFYGVTRQRPITLPDDLASAARVYPQPVTYTVTLISSFLSIITAFLYANSIKYAVAMSLSQPVSLFTLTSCIRVAGKSPITNFVRPYWTLAAAICAVALSTQTAGWATLLTPQLIGIPTGMTGYGLDIGNEDFINMVTEEYGEEMLITDIYPNVMPIVAASGAAALSAHFGLPGILNYNQLSFVNSTGGILPANIFALDSAINTGQQLPVHTFLDQNIHSPKGFSTNYTVTQQGLTADIHCEQRNLTDTTNPSVQFFTVNQTFINTTVTFESMVVGCGVVGPIILGIPDNTTQELSAILTDFCINTDTGYDVIVVGQGTYSFLGTMVCNVQPQITIVDVNYNGGSSLFNTNSWPNFITISPPRKIIAGFDAGLLPLATVLRALGAAQTLTGNTIGDLLSSFYVSYVGNKGEGVSVEIMESFIRGVIEFGGTLLRASYTETNNSLFVNDTDTSAIPPSFQIPTNGTYYTETIGWYQHTSAVPGVLLAPTFVSLSSILIILITLYKTRRFLEVDEQDYFDAGNILHVMAAAGAGGLPGDFPAYSKDKKVYLEYSQGVNVRLGHVEGTGRVGFVQHQEPAE
ncbi:hypothetical protein BDN72DRAFT_197586 [Pluteus cervinus]|uniref:Uncharacterized protein n=1 Tax=Pluteus cervinus TaxID=181527 RepID=A0ACD3B6Q7_9AGAR|nr:hypothetical protein BDN72DRAFT_197586 [Pluteus cervinus]